jgi:uncharacterized membrane protein YqjE
MKIEENLKDLFDQVKDIADTRIDLFKLDLVEKLSRVFYLLVLILVILVFISIILVFLSLTAGSFIGTITGSATVGYLSITCLYLFLLVLMIWKRKKWFLNPILRQMASIFFPNSNQDGNS